MNNHGNNWLFKAFMRAGVVGFAFLVVIFLSGWPEGYCYFWPSIGTRFAKGYSEEKFSKIRPGMSCTQVSNILGAPLCACPDSSYKVEQWFYSLDKDTGPDFAWLVRIVLFTNGFVLRTEKTMGYD